MYNDGKKDRGIVIKVCTRMARTGGFAQLASKAHQMRLPFRQRHRIDCLNRLYHKLHHPLVRNIGEGRSGPQTVSAKTLNLRIRPSRYRITDLYIYTSCSAVAVIVVELRPGRHYCHAHMHLYIGCCLLTCCISFIISKYNLRGHLCNQRKNISIYLILIVSVVPHQ